MEFSWPIFAVVLLLGILQVAAGVVIGQALPLGRRRSDRAVQRRAGHLVELASRLFRVVNSVAEDVDRHQARIRHASHALSTAQPDESRRLAEIVLKTVGEVVEVNGHLQGRLAAAEEKLRTQARQIEALYMAVRTVQTPQRADDPAGDAVERPAANRPDPAEIQHTCEDLRSRLAEIADEA